MPYPPLRQRTTADHLGLARDNAVAAVIVLVQLRRCNCMAHVLAAGSVVIGAAAAALLLANHIKTKGDAS